jgi:hypothetical protein
VQTVPTTTIPPPYPPLAELAGRAPAETAEAYGLRALLYVTAERRTLPVDTEGLELAAHAFRLAVANRDLSPTGAEQLADVGRLITGALARRRQLDAAEAAQTAQTAARRAGEDRPDVGPMAPLAPAPAPQTPPSAAQTARRPALAPVPAPPVRLAPIAPLSAAELF